MTRNKLGLCLYVMSAVFSVSSQANANTVPQPTNETKCVLSLRKYAKQTGLYDQVDLKVETTVCNGTTFRGASEPPALCWVNAMLAFKEKIDPFAAATLCHFANGSHIKSPNMQCYRKAVEEANPKLGANSGLGFQIPLAGALLCHFVAAPLDAIHCVNYVRRTLAAASALPPPSIGGTPPFDIDLVSAVLCSGDRNRIIERCFDAALAHLTREDDKTDDQMKRAVMLCSAIGGVYPGGEN